jgi:hypothetical protein
MFFLPIDESVGLNCLEKSEKIQWFVLQNNSPVTFIRFLTKTDRTVANEKLRRGAGINFNLLHLVISAKLVRYAICVYLYRFMGRHPMK